MDKNNQNRKKHNYIFLSTIDKTMIELKFYVIVEHKENLILSGLDFNINPRDSKYNGTSIQCK